MITIISVILCVLFSAYTIAKSKSNSSQGIIDNGSQNVVTVGVIFIFIGIAISLFNFNTDPKTMGESINIFLDGMKSAFYTSIIGMIAGLIIKYIQSGTKQRSDSAVMTHLSQISSVREAVGEVKSANHDDTQRIVDTLQALQKSVEAGSTANLSKELSEMSQRMSEFINSVNASQSDMRQLIKSFAGFQSQMSKDITGISASIQSMSDNQSKQISSMKDTLSEQLSSMGASFTAM